MNINTSARPAAPSVLRRNWRLTLLTVPALLLALTGCTGGDSGTSSAPNGNDTTAEQPTTDAEFSAARDAYDLKLAECFRKQGLDVKDPKPGEGILEDTPEIREAYPACAAEIGEPPTWGGGTMTADELDQLLAQAKCLREKGYEIQEPTLADPGFIPAEVSDADRQKCAV